MDARWDSSTTEAGPHRQYSTYNMCQRSEYLQTENARRVALTLTDWAAPPLIPFCILFIL